jgi:hypothetical protein
MTERHLFGFLKKSYTFASIQMKKIAPIFLLCIFLFNTVGYYIAFTAVQYQIKSEVKSEMMIDLSLDKLTSVTVNTTDQSKIQWFEDGKEMEFNGERYDIVKSTKNNKSTTYYCIDDKQEETLFENLDKHINTHIAANKPLKNQAAKNLENDVVKIYFSNQFSFIFNDNTSSQQGSFLYNSINYISSLIEPNSPPPEFA